MPSGIHRAVVVSNLTPSRSIASIGTDEHFRWLQGIVKVVVVLNLVDATLTLLWVWGGLAHEANPLLADLVRQYPVGFAATKLALVGLGTLLLWRLRERPLAVIAIFLAFLAYYYLLLMHVRFLALLVGEWLFG
jgi:Domain of unknown function (DUF5658)